MSYCDQGRLFTFEDFFADGDDNHRLLLVLWALEDDALIGKLECQRKGRRDHYPVRMLWQSLVGAKVYGIATVNGLIRELRRKLSKPENLAMLKGIFDKAVSDLKEILPDLGESLHSWYGYTVELVADTRYEIPLNFEVLPANVNECPRLPILLGDTMRLQRQFDVKYVMGDRGYDCKYNCKYVLYDLEALPIIKMRLTQADRNAEFSAEICRCTELGTPICDCGAKMVYAGRDGKYLKFRCCGQDESLGCPCSTSRYGRVLKIAVSDNERRWPGLHRESKKFKRLYKRRTSVERINSRLKEHLCLDQQHVRGLAKTKVNVGLSLLVMVGGALATARNKKLDNLRQIVAMAA